MASKILPSVADLVGHTPLIALQRLRPKGGAEVCGKLESRNPGGSVKDRAALAMIRAAERAGSLAKGATIVEATSGNTGISLAMMAAVSGYRCVIVMPEDMSVSRRAVLRALGAEVLLTPAEGGMTAAVERADALANQEIKGRSFVPRQFANEANPQAHYDGTAQEIWQDTDGQIHAFVAGVGTGGTVSGVGRYLKEQDAAICIVAVEPRASPVLSGGEAGLHGIQGLGAGFVPEVLDREVLDRVITVSDPAAHRMAERLAREEGVFVGPSAGANVHAACQVAAELGPTQRVVTILCDTGERYV